MYSCFRCNTKKSKMYKVKRLKDVEYPYDTQILNNPKKKGIRSLKTKADVVLCTKCRHELGMKSIHPSHMYNYML